jgi:hypothetical protein
MEAAAAQFAAHGDGKAATFAPTTEDPVEDTHFVLPDRIRQFENRSR